MRVREWTILCIFVFFISSGHSFWPLKKQVVLVKKGTCFTIKPGTRIETDSIKVEGAIVAIGTADMPIVFAGTEICLDYSQSNVFTYCIFEHADLAIHAHFSSLTISNSLFENNNEGCRLGFSECLIENNIFRFNKSYGINFKAGKNSIKNNSIIMNRVGVFITENGSQSEIVSNNIFNNVEYNLQLGDFHREDINAPGNFWGKEIDCGKFIYDKEDDQNLGKVNFLPVVKEEIQCSIPTCKTF